MSVSHVITSPDPDAFRAHVTTAQYGAISVTGVRSSASHARRPRSRLGDDFGEFARIAFVRSGTHHVEQHDRSFEVASGQVSLTLNDSPSEARAHGFHEIVQFYLPADTLVVHGLDPIQLGQAAWPRSDLAEEVAAILTRLIYSDETRSPGAARLVEHAVVDLTLALAMDLHGISVPREAGEVATRIRIVDYLGRHHRDPGLTVARVAEVFHLSVRTVHRLFEGCESVGSVIRARRLDCAAELLRNPSWSGRTVDEIARACGYSTGGQFRRAFRDRFGVSPREYRWRVQQGWASPTRAPSDGTWMAATLFASEVRRSWRGVIPVALFTARPKWLRLEKPDLPAICPMDRCR